eukprot:scaffold3510_cov326-Prasinococcus_capsulatus_cf.AAC.1
MGGGLTRSLEVGGWPAGRQAGKTHTHQGAIPGPAIGQSTSVAPASAFRAQSRAPFTARRARPGGRPAGALRRARHRRDPPPHPEPSRRGCDGPGGYGPCPVGERAHQQALPVRVAR